MSSSHWVPVYVPRSQVWREKLQERSARPKRPSKVGWILLFTLFSDFKVHMSYPCILVKYMFRVSRSEEEA
jgi:hypothetical protein